jgi:hypothetical protein
VVDARPIEGKIAGFAVLWLRTGSGVLTNVRLKPVTTVFRPRSE